MEIIYTLALHQSWCETLLLSFGHISPLILMWCTHIIYHIICPRRCNFRVLNCRTLLVPRQRNSAAKENRNKTLDTRWWENSKRIREGEPHPPLSSWSISSMGSGPIMAFLSLRRECISSIVNQFLISVCNNIVHLEHCYYVIPCLSLRTVSEMCEGRGNNVNAVNLVEKM